MFEMARKYDENTFSPEEKSLSHIFSRKSALLPSDTIRSSKKFSKRPNSISSVNSSST